MTKRWNIDQMPSLEGKVAIVTGANSGLGYYTTRGLATKGAEVIMACRNIDKADLALREILKEMPAAKLKIMELDLSDLSSVKAFASKVKSQYSQLDVLINNAGLMVIPYRKTADGFEMQFGVNHLGHFALTGQLFSLLASTTGARLVVVSSAAQKMGTIDFENLNWERNYRKWKAYFNSKFANLLFMIEMAERISVNGVDLKVVAAHPGYAASNLLEKGPAMNGRTWLVKAGHLANRIAAQSAEMGALPTLYAASSSDVNNGDYYGPGGFAEMKGYPSRVYPNNKKITKELRVKLWKKSEELTGITFL